MAWDITTGPLFTIEIDNGWYTLSLPMLTIWMVVDEPYITIYWADSQKGRTGVTRTTGAIDYQDITFGYTSYGSASLVELEINRMITTAFGGSGGGEDLADTLLIGNTTGGTDIEISAGDFLVVDDATPSSVAGFNASNELVSLESGVDIMRQIFKTADETISSDDTISPDSTLKFNFLASKNYYVRGFVAFVTTANADFQFAFSPAGLTFAAIRMNWTIAAGSPIVAGVRREDNLTTAQAVLSTSAGRGYVEFEAVFTAAGAGGTFSFDWAQGTSDASNTTVKAGSMIEYKQVD